VYLRWIPWSLTVDHKIKRTVISSEFLACFEAEGQAFVSWIVTADEM
jgi:hypothetical protein